MKYDHNDKIKIIVQVCWNKLSCLHANLSSAYMGIYFGWK